MREDAGDLLFLSRIIAMLINITVVTWNRLRLTRLCLESLLGKIRDNVIVHLVDNGSTDGTPEYLRDVAARHERVRLFALPRNMGVAVAANLGWAALDADFYLKLDNDMITLRPDWLDVLLDTAGRNPEVGLAAYQVCSWHKTVPVTLSSGDVFLDSDCCGGACVLVPRRSHETFGFWNEDYGKYGFEDMEYGIRVGLGGYRAGYVPASDCVAHLGYAEEAVDEAQERSKSSFVESDDTGKKLYVLNRLLFESGIRSLYVDRKYLPDCSSDIVRFRSNPEYRAVLKLQRDYLSRVSYAVDTAGIHLDLTRLKA